MIVKNKIAEIKSFLPKKYQCYLEETVRFIFNIQGSKVSSLNSQKAKNGLNESKHHLPLSFSSKTRRQTLRTAVGLKGLPNTEELPSYFSSAPPPLTYSRHKK